LFTFGGLFKKESGCGEEKGFGERNRRSRRVRRVFLPAAIGGGHWLFSGISDKISSSGLIYMLQRKMPGSDPGIFLWSG